MSYQVLARKWRPRDFSEMVGQTHVQKALINALDRNTLHHAYLFTGTRGVGKTTVARILAKCLNCETGISSRPCGRCGSCLEIAEGRSVDLIEVDAASRTKVEDTRDLLDNVQYAPTRSRFKVYLIDEVHMLSGHSFNALLKTLEEPPPHVKFLLATTDPQKLPITVLSRCLQFHLKNMAPELIAEHLATILTQEGAPFDARALQLLGQAAQGSMRDALSLTDQALAHGAGSVGEAVVREMLGSVDRRFVLRLLECAAADDTRLLLDEIGDVLEQVADVDALLEEMLAALHRLAIVQAIGPAPGDDARLAILAAALTAEDLQLWYQLVINARRDMPVVADGRATLEMLLIRLQLFRGAAQIAVDVTAPDLVPVAEAAATSVLRAPVESGAAVSAAPAAAAEAAAPVKKPPEVDAAVVPAARVVATNADWLEVFPDLRLGGIMQSVFSHAALDRAEPGKVWLRLGAEGSALYDPSQLQRLDKELTRALGQSITVALEPGAPVAMTPARQTAEQQATRLAAAQQALAEDPGVRLLLERFDGELQADSITLSVNGN